MRDFRERAPDTKILAHYSILVLSERQNLFVETLYMCCMESVDHIRGFLKTCSERLSCGVEISCSHVDSRT